MLKKLAVTVTKFANVNYNFVKYCTKEKPKR